MKASGNFLDAVAYPTMVTKDQWLARRAELQNKPSWADAPEWAEWLAKDSPDKDEESAWWWYADKPVAMKNTWQVSTDGRAWMVASCHCDLGDWRDTLEKRPEEFKPFASIEDNQELSMTQQQVKQDNGWFERGELPPVGVECEAKKYGKEEWYKVVICGAGKHLGLAVAFYEKQKGSDAFTCSSAEYFRPVRTERDVLIEIIKKTDDTDDRIADAILAAGFKRGTA